MPDSADPLAANAFWSYSARVYSRPGVTDACLKLQDDFSLDVNLLLFCLWCAAEGPGRLNGDDFDQIEQRLGTWQTDTVQPLRTIRRQSRDELGDELAGFFRASMLQAELDAERVEQELLFRWAGERQRDPEIAVAAEAARNLVVYLARQGVSAGQVAPQLRALLAAVVEKT
jgi:uncharacterized protein (TIGR02444 family)